MRAVVKNMINLDVSMPHLHHLQEYLNFKLNFSKIQFKMITLKKSLKKLNSTQQDIS